jgi:hypothetical protein
VAVFRCVPLTYHSHSQIKRALVMRLRPVLERMEEISKEEKSSVESATGMVPRRTNVGGYEYVECATGQVSDAEEYVARYLTYVDKAKAERLIAAQVSPYFSYIQVRSNAGTLSF